MWALFEDMIRDLEKIVSFCDNRRYVNEAVAKVSKHTTSFLVSENSVCVAGYLKQTHIID
jgi:hypothetical protein